LAFHSGRETDHSPPSSAEVKEWVELYLHSPNTSSWRGAQLGEHRDNFTFTFYHTADWLINCISKLYGVLSMCVFLKAIQIKFQTFKIFESFVRLLS
jgi:hypothetical protein